MATAKTHEPDHERIVPDCAVRLAPLYLTHSVLLVVAIGWLFAVLTG